MNTHVLAASTALLMSLPAAADVRSSQSVIVDSGETVRGNLYAAAGSVIVHGDVEGDLVATGGTIVVDGDVHGDVLAFGGQITISGDVGGAVRAVGGQIALLGAVGGDAAAAGGEVTIEGRVGGDALVAGGTSHLVGAVDGRVYVAGGEMDVEGPVGRGVLARGQLLTLGPGARVTGDIDATTARDIERAPGAVVGGEVHRVPLEAPARSAAGAVFAWMQLLFGSMILGLLWLFVFRNFAQRSVGVLREQPIRCLGLGAVAFFGAPLVLAFVLAAGVLIGGWWLAFMGASVYSIAVALTFPLVALLLGRLAFHALKISAGADWLPMILALFVLLLVAAIPVVGVLVALATIVFGLGAISIALAGTLARTR